MAVFNDGPGVTMRRNWWRCCGSVAAACVAVLGLTVSPAQARSASAPDLVIDSVGIKGQPANHAFITLDESSHASGFEVTVSLHNEGREKSAKSVAAVRLEQKGRQIGFKDTFIEPVRPGRRQTTVSIPVDDLKAEPGFVTAIVSIKWAITKTRQREESESLKPIPVIARDWTVSYFHTTLNAGGPGLSSDTFGELKLMFRFSRLDDAREQFVYVPVGQITTRASYDAGGCSGSGSRDMTLTPWPDSYLLIKADLTRYSAGIDTSKQPAVTFSATCPSLGNFSIPVQAPWSSLATFTGKGALSMRPEQTALTDEGSKMTPAGELKFTWSFIARLSGV